MTQRDENRSLYLSYHEHCNGHASDRMASLYTSPMKVNGVPLDPAIVAAQFPPLFSAFPDWHWEILNLVVDGDYIVGRFTGTGTHRGAFQGIEATGRRVTISEFTLYRVENGKFAEVWDLAVDGQSGFPDAVRRAVEHGGAPSA
jgi:predicted ester cyclase